MHLTRSSFRFTLTFALTAAAACVDPGDPGAGAEDEVVGSTEAASWCAEPELPAAARADLRQTLDALVAAGIGPGVTASIDHPDYRVFSDSAGLANLATGRELEPGHRFRAGSIMKTAVAAAVLQLVERGKLSLDARLTQILPASIASRIAEARHITLRMLLNHTAGVPEVTGGDFHARVFAEPAKVWTLDEYLAISAAQPRPFAPGTGWEYSNMNFIVAGAVIEHATGRPWREVVERRVLERAGLDHSSLPRPGTTACPGCARGYELIDGSYADYTGVDPSMAEASGGSAFVTTTEDLIKLLRALASGALFDKPSTLATLMAGFVDAPVPAEAQTQYGLGLMRIQFAGMNMIGHYGGTAGFGSFVLLDQNTGIAISGQMNRRGNFGAFIIPIMQSASRL